MQIDQTKFTGAVIALIGAIATLCSVFNFILPTTDIDLIFTSLVAIYGAVHQMVAVAKTNKAGVVAGTMRPK